MSKILTLIVTYNGSSFIKNCINSIYDSQIISEVLVIDNYSLDDTLDVIKSNFPKVKLITNQENLGFGKANNIGLKYAIEKEFDMVFLLNQDTVIFSDTIQNLLNVFENIHNLGFISPLHLDHSLNAFESNFEYFLNLSFRRKLISELFFKSCGLNYVEVDFINAAAWLIPVSTIKKVGGFNPIFPHYCEDIDYFNRLRFFGFKNYIVYNSFIKHYSDGGGVIKTSRLVVNREVFEKVAILSNINYSFLFLMRSILIKFIGDFLLNIYPLNFRKIKLEFFILVKLILKSRSIIKSRDYSRKGSAFL